MKPLEEFPAIKKAVNDAIASGLHRLHTETDDPTYLEAQQYVVGAIKAHEFMSGNNLHNKMTGDFGEKMQALGFIQGVFDVYVSVTFCSPENVTAGQVSDMVKRYLDNNPSTRHKTAESLINQALKQAWPCANNRGGTRL